MCSLGVVHRHHVWRSISGFIKIKVLWYAVSLGDFDEFFHFCHFLLVQGTSILVLLHVFLSCGTHICAVFTMCIARYLRYKLSITAVSFIKLVLWCTFFTQATRCNNSRDVVSGHCIECLFHIHWHKKAPFAVFSQPNGEYWVINPT